MTTAHSLAKPSAISSSLARNDLGMKSGKVGVDVAGVLEHAIEGPLHLLPDGVAVRLDDHAAAHVGVLRQAGVLDDVEIPLGIILVAGSDLFRHERVPCSEPCVRRRFGGQRPRSSGSLRWRHFMEIAAHRRENISPRGQGRRGGVLENSMQCDPRTHTPSANRRKSGNGRCRCATVANPRGNVKCRIGGRSPDSLQGVAAGKR